MEASLRMESEFRLYSCKYNFIHFLLKMSRMNETTLGNGVLVMLKMWIDFTISASITISEESGKRTDICF